MGKLTLYFHRGISKITSRFYPNVTGSSFVDHSNTVYNRSNLVMAENTNIDAGATIMNTRAKFIMKRNSGAAIGLTVITGGHISMPGRFFKDITDKDKDILDPSKSYDKDIIVEEDVWIGSKVTLLKGTHLGRGCVVGSNACVRNAVPPYSTVIGNPALSSLPKKSSSTRKLSIPRMNAFHWNFLKRTITSTLSVELKK